MIQTFNLLSLLQNFPIVSTTKYIYIYIGKEDKDLPSSAMWVARFIRGKTTHIGVNVIPA